MSRREQIAQLREHKPVILPSLLLCDFGNLAEEVARLTTAGVRGLHLDVMDGHFVPNLTYGMPIVAAVRRLTPMPLDVHLMISDPGSYIDAFLEAGADSITFHIEAVSDPIPILERIRACGAAAGLAINPATPLSGIESVVSSCDLVLVMSVPAGFGGQAFDDTALQKLRRLREIAPEVLLEVDGGVNQRTIVPCAAAGAEFFVVGSAIFQHSDYSQVVHELVQLATVR